MVARYNSSNLSPPTKRLSIVSWIRSNVVGIKQEGYHGRAILLEGLLKEKDYDVSYTRLSDKVSEEGSRFFRIIRWLVIVYWISFSCKLSSLFSPSYSQGLLFLRAPRLPESFEAEISAVKLTPTYPSTLTKSPSISCSVFTSLLVSQASPPSSFATLLETQRRDYAESPSLVTQCEHIKGTMTLFLHCVI